MTSKAIFSTSNGRQLFSFVNPQLTIYIDLNSIIYQIDQINVSYINGDINTVIDFIQSGDIYSTANLLNIVSQRSQQYPNIVQSVKYNLNMLNNFSKVVNQYNNCQIIANKFAIAQANSDILTNPILLKQYIESHKKNMIALPKISINVIPPIIKEEYVTYINLYGYPKNSIFDASLMGAIIANMNV